MKSGNKPVNDMIIVIGGHVDDIKTWSGQNLFALGLHRFIRRDIPVANKTNKSRKVVYVDKKVRQLFSECRINEIVLSV